MIKFEFVTNTEESYEASKENRVAVNGIIDHQSFYSLFRKERDGYVRLYNSDAINELKEATVEEVKQTFQDLGLYDVYEFEGFSVEVQIRSGYRHSHFRNASEIIFLLHFDFEYWNRPYSIIDLSEEVSMQTRSIPAAAYYPEDEEEPPSNGFGIIFRFDDINITIGSLIASFREKFDTVIKESISQVVYLSDKDVLITIFQFPDTMKTACKQYLIYFAQFLQNLGIEADMELSDSSAGTLFKVIPKDADEALQNIKEALQVYLTAPAAPSFEVEVLPNNDVAGIQWQANIMHMKSQLMMNQAALQMSQATIQMKDATIGSLQLTNYQLKEKLTKKEGMENQSEDIISGIVSVSSIESNGFKFNLAEILRRLKGKLKKDS